MKYRFQLSFPNSANGTMVPGALAGLLAATLCAQLIWADAEPEPPTVLQVGAARFNVAVPKFAPVTAQSVIFERPLFAPRQPLAGSASAGAGALLGGAVVAGTVAIRGQTFAVIRSSNGVISNLKPGAVIGGWRLVALRDAGAIFVKGDQRREVAYGAASVVAVPEDAPAE